MNTRTRLLSKKSGLQSYGESCLEGGEFLTTIYLSHISPFHICFSVKKDFLQGKQGPGSCSCKVSKMTPAQLSFCSRAYSIPTRKTHSFLLSNHSTASFRTVIVFLIWFLFQDEWATKNNRDSGTPLSTTAGVPSPSG